jgi:hypothetical protein
MDLLLAQGEHVLRRDVADGTVQADVRDTTPIAALMCLLCCGLVGCSPVGEIGLRHPDDVLFERAMYAVELKHFDVAHITLQTLINTYPDSLYAARAKSALRDPRIADCGDAW